MYKIRQLGYGLECGVIELSEINVESRNIAIFSTSGIAGYVMTSEQSAVLFSESGEAVRFNCETGKVEFRSRPFSQNIRYSKLLYNAAQKEIAVITQFSIHIVDDTELLLTSKFNAAVKTEAGDYTLLDFADVQEKFQALSDKELAERTAIRERAQARGEEPILPPKQWYGMGRLGKWPANHGSYCKLSFNPDHAVINTNGQLIIPYTSGIAKVSLGRKTLIFKPFSKKYSNMRNGDVDVRAVSHDGNYIIADHIGLDLPERQMQQEAPPRKKGIFGRIKLHKNISSPKCRFPLELWSIQETPQLVKLIPTGEFDYHELFLQTRGEWTLPNDWYDEAKRQRLNSCLLAAAQPQFDNIADKLEWSEQDFAIAIKQEMKRHKVDLNDIVNQSRGKDKGLKFHSIIGNRYTFCHLIDHIRNRVPDFFQIWDSQNLNDEQKSVLLLIYQKLKFHRDHNLALCFESNDRKLHTVLRSGHISSTDLETEEVTIASIVPLPKPDSNISWKEASRNITLSHLVENKLRFTYPYACLDIPISDSKDIASTRTANLIYDRDSFVVEEKLAIKLVRKIRYGYIPIRSKTVDNYVTGLEKLTAEFVKHHEEIIIGNRWDPGLIYKNNLVDEYEITDFLIEQKAVQALPTLERFVQAIMDVQPANTDPTRDWQLWHNNSEGHVGAPTITAIIRLSKSVSPQALKYARQRDFEHDVYMEDQALPVKILPFLDIKTAGLLNLVSIVALQLLATGRAENNIFASHGMEAVKQAIISGELTPNHFASVLIEEVKLLNGNLSWASERGPHGLIAQTVYGLNRSETWQDQLAIELLNQYPEAKEFLDSAQ